MGSISAQPLAGREWYEIWWDVWVHPGAETFRRILQEPDASYLRGFKWIALMAFIGVWPGSLISLIFRQNVASITFYGFLTSLLLGAIVYPVLSVIVLVITAAIYHWIARLFGGKGAWGQMVFCLSAIQSPLFLLTALSSILISLVYGSLQYQPPLAFYQQVGMLSICLALPAMVLGIYLIVLFVCAIMAVENLEAGRSVVTYFTPAMVSIALGCCLVSGVIFTGGVLRSANVVQSTRISLGTSTGGSRNVGGSWNIASTGLPVTSMISSLAINPAAPSTLYAATNSGVFKSTNGGLSWNPANSGLKAGHINTLAIDPLIPSTLYAGVQAGVYKSTDSGESWKAVNSGLPAYPQVNILAINPVRQTTLYAGTNVGVFKSTDGGESWQVAGSGLPGKPVYALVIDPKTPATLYAGMGAGSSHAMFKSMNNGERWELADTGLPADIVSALLIDPETPTTLYAGTDNNGIFKSTDGGQSWSSSLVTAFPVRALVVDPKAPATLYAGTRGGGVYRSTDNGGSWQMINSGLPIFSSVQALAIDPKTPTTLYAGTVGGEVYKYRR